MLEVSLTFVARTDCKSARSGKQAWIPRKNWPNQPYFVYGSNNPYTNW